MKFSDVFTLVSEGNENNNENNNENTNNISFNIKGKLHRFTSDKVNMNYVMLYLKIHEKLPKNTKKEFSLQMLYDTDLGDIPTEEEQANYLIKFESAYETSVGHYEKLCYSLGNNIRLQLRTFNRTAQSVNILELGYIKNEDLFRKKMLDLEFNNLEDCATILKPNVVRAKYLLLHIHFMNEDGNIGISNSELGEYDIGLPSLRDQDEFIKQSEDYISNLKELRELRVFLRTLVKLNFFSY